MNDPTKKIKLTNELAMDYFSRKMNFPEVLILDMCIPKVKKEFTASDLEQKIESNKTVQNFLKTMEAMKQEIPSDVPALLKRYQELQLVLPSDKDPSKVVKSALCSKLIYPASKYSAKFMEELVKRLKK